jgi:predicted phosphodiesterase
LTSRRALVGVVLLTAAACGQATIPTATTQPTPLPPTASRVPPTVEPATQLPTTVPSPSAPAYDMGPLLNAPLGDIGYSVPLIIRHVTSDTVILEFRLEASAQGRLVVVPDQPEGEPQIIAFDGVGGEFEVSGLTPGAGYRAAVVFGASGSQTQPGFLGEPWGEVHFKTQPTTPDTFRVAVVGDSGFGEAVTRQLGALMATFAPDFVIHTGDLVYNLQENRSPAAGFQSKLFQPFGPVLRMAPFYPTLGNHDLESAALTDGEPYGLTAFAPFIDPGLSEAAPDSRGWYAIVQRGIQFVFLNSQVAFGYPGRSDETAWLKARLADPSVRASIVVLHVPFYNSGRHSLESVPVRQTWGDIIQAANVPLVLSGHDHNYQRFVEQGKTYLISGGGSSHLYQVPIPDRNLQAWAVRTHFVLLTFTADTIELQAIGLDGSVFDEASIPLPLAAGSIPGEARVAWGAERLAAAIP